MIYKIFNIVGWLLLLVYFVWWIGFGYSDWLLILILAAYVCFSISNGRIKKIKKIKSLSPPQMLLIISAFITSIAIVFGLIQLSNYLIQDFLKLHGWLKTFAQFVSVIFLLYPVKFALGSIVNRVSENLEVESIKLDKKDYRYEDIKKEAEEMLKFSTEIMIIKSLREKYGLSLIDAKKIVDDVK